MSGELHHHRFMYRVRRHRHESFGHISDYHVIAFFDYDEIIEDGIAEFLDKDIARYFADKLNDAYAKGCSQGWGEAIRTVTLEK